LGTLTCIFKSHIEVKKERKEKFSGKLVRMRVLASVHFSRVA
jgi:hypothetical protein